MAYVRRPWTDEDIKLLRAMAQYLPATLIAERLNRGLSSIKFKLSNLGIRLRDRGWVCQGSPRHWTPKEVSILKRHAGKLTSLELQKLLPQRSSKSIKIKASALGLTLFKTPWSSEDLDNLLSLREQGKSFVEIAKVFKRSPEACRAKYSYLTKFD